MSEKQEPLRILVTGEHEELSTDCPLTLESGRPLQWIQLPVLGFERLPIDPAFIQDVVKNPYQWILFTSQRSVRFWTEVLMENQLDFPTETQVACIGETTAQIAARDGFSPDFFPTEPGTEKFLEEFEHMISNTPEKPRVFIPMAEGGRTTIADRLEELECEVLTVPLYRSIPLDDIDKRITPEDLARIGVVLFTSPSSVDAFTSRLKVPSAAKIVAIGRYTRERLEKKGLESDRVLPGGDYSRIGEVL